MKNSFRLPSLRNDSRSEKTSNGLTDGGGTKERPSSSEESRVEGSSGPLRLIFFFFFWDLLHR